MTKNFQTGKYIKINKLFDKKFKNEDIPCKDIAASFQYRICDTLIKKTKHFSLQREVRTNFREKAAYTKSYQMSFTSNWHLCFFCGRDHDSINKWFHKSVCYYRCTKHEGESLYLPR